MENRAKAETENYPGIDGEERRQFFLPRRRASSE